MVDHRGRWLIVLAVAAVAACELVRGGPDSTNPRPVISRQPGVAATAPNDATGHPDPTQRATDDPAHFAPQVIKHAHEARISPQLVMAILYNESDKPHDPSLERAWQKIKPDAAFGIANMHRSAFDETKHDRNFADRRWEELPDDPDLAITAAAWYLHDLAARLPTRWSGPYTKNELLALGYDAGPANMLAFARGAKPGETAQSYLDRLRQNWARARQALRR